jgi:D-alanine-D-alanine ligase
VIADRAPTALSAAEVIEHARQQSSRALRPGRETVLVAHPSDETLLTIERRPASKRDDDNDHAVVTGLGLDVVFPVLHGPYGEDGTVQGLLELANVPYVGPGVMASSVGMDKAAMKVMFAARGLPVCDWKAFADWDGHRDKVIDSLRTLGLPVFVKPANLGSSVGISKVKVESDLAPAIEAALEFDRKIVVEAAVPEAREIECAVLGNDTPEASVPGEVRDVAEVRRLAIDAFKAIDAAGMSRVDFLLSRTSGKIYVNEINTIPGFTTISMYAKMWDASGVSYSALVDRLIQLALERHADKQRLRTSVL